MMSQVTHGFIYTASILFLMLIGYTASKPCPPCGFWYPVCSRVPASFLLPSLNISVNTRITTIIETNVAKFSPHLSFIIDLCVGMSFCLATDIQVSVAFFVPIDLKPGTPVRIPSRFNLIVVLVDGHVLLPGPADASPESGINP